MRGWAHWINHFWRAFLFLMISFKNLCFHKMRRNFAPSSVKFSLSGKKFFCSPKASKKLKSASWRMPYFDYFSISNFVYSFSDFWEFSIYCGFLKIITFWKLYVVVFDSIFPFDSLLSEEGFALPSHFTYFVFLARRSKKFPKIFSPIFPVHYNL